MHLILHQLLLDDLLVLYHPNLSMLLARYLAQYVKCHFQSFLIVLLLGLLLILDLLFLGLSFLMIVFVIMTDSIFELFSFIHFLKLFRLVRLLLEYRLFFVKELQPDNFKQN